MFHRLGRFVAKRPGLVIAAWIVALVPVIGIGVGYAAAHHWNRSDGRQAGMLPGRYESARAQQRSDAAFGAPSGNGSAVLVFTRKDGGRLSAQDMTDTADVARRLTGQQAARRDAARHSGGRGGPPPAGVQVAPPTNQDLSPDGRVLVAQVVFDVPSDDPSVATSVANLHQDTTVDLAGMPVQARLTGEAAALVDDAAAGQWVTLAMVGAIFLLLLVLFRSVIVAATGLITITLIGEGVAGLLTIATHLAGARLDQTASSLLPVVLFGVGTDYIVFLMFRYRERLRDGDEHRAAIATGIGRVGEAMVASALAVAVSFSAMLVSQLSSFRVLGPALGLAVLVMLLAALTLVPAVFAVVGRRLSRRKSWRTPARPGRLADRIAAAVTRRPAQVLLLTVALLGGLALFATGYRADYNQNPFQTGSQAAAGYADLTSGFPAGALSPVQVLVTDNTAVLNPTMLTPYAQNLTHLPGIGQGGITRISPDGHTAQIDLILTDNPTGAAALQTLTNTIRPTAHSLAPAGTTVLVGGETAAYADIATALNRDMRLIFPLAGLAIGLILLLMLRALAAPLYLMGTVVLGFAATLGATVLLFQHAAHLPGVQFQVPLIVYLFVASIGTDYNILMISRVREELHTSATPHQAVRTAVRHAGPSVAAAGLVLATSFGVLGFSATTAQIGIPVALGVLISTFATAWLLVPAATALLGRRAFWPSRPTTTTPTTTDQAPRTTVTVEV